MRARASSGHLFGSGKASKPRRSNNGRWTSIDSINAFVTLDRSYKAFVASVSANDASIDLGWQVGRGFFERSESEVEVEIFIPASLEEAALALDARDDNEDERELATGGISLIGSASRSRARLVPPLYGVRVRHTFDEAARTATGFDKGIRGEDVPPALPLSRSVELGGNEAVVTDAGLHKSLSYNSQVRFGCRGPVAIGEVMMLLFGGRLR